MDERARGRNKVKKGLTFTLMVVGASGTGKTTFVNTLCAKPVLEHKESDDPEHAHIEEGVRIKPVTVGTVTAPSFLRLLPLFNFISARVYSSWVLIGYRSRGRGDSHCADGCRYAWVWRSN